MTEQEPEENESKFGYFKIKLDLEEPKDSGNKTVIVEYGNVDFECPGREMGLSIGMALVRLFPTCGDYELSELQACVDAIKENVYEMRGELFDMLQDDIEASEEQQAKWEAEEIKLPKE